MISYAYKNFLQFCAESMFEGTKFAQETEMTADNRMIATELKRRLKKKVGLVDFRIFGSRARGDESEYSDMDIFLEVEKIDKKIKGQILDIVWEVGFAHGIVISPLIFTREEIEKSPLRASPIVKNIMEEGVSL